MKHGDYRVTLSRNETESLCMKAARGAGFSWGMAEEVGFATGWLAAQGIDGTAALLEMLTRKLARPAIFGRPISVPGHWQTFDDSPLCPIQLGVALIDRAAIEDGPFSQVTLLDPVETPLLLLPFLVRAAQISQRSLTLDWQGGRLAITPDGTFNRQAAVAWIDPNVLAMKITTASNVSVEPLSTDPAHLPSILASTMNGLGALALRTTVPATNASRSGAGSATADND
jgi:hypothetical protein